MNAYLMEGIKNVLPSHKGIDRTSTKNKKAQPNFLFSSIAFRGRLQADINPLKVDNTLNYFDMQTGINPPEADKALYYNKRIRLCLRLAGPVCRIFHPDTSGFITRPTSCPTRRFTL